MGWPPAVVIVVRHGARLDAADKQWHLTSPTPYDPPLTYGGWTQSRALGTRIASILRSRETDDDSPDGAEAQHGENRRKRRHKVIIHTSPFLRCVQTSVAISAGLAQNPGHRRTSSHPTSAISPSLKPSQMHSSPKVRPTVATGSPSLAPILEPVSTLGNKAEKASQIKKSTIRVDAFLGEWLSPDYFELITPPPSSIMMVAGAKADLLRREDYSSLVYTKDVSSALGNQPFPGGWGSPVVMAESMKEKDEGALSALPALAHALPRRDRTSSLSSVGSSGSHGSHHSGRTSKNPPTLVAPAEHGVYQVPVPNYAISSSDPIPSGYVAHARDNCVDIDYQWDSMRDPQNWGNGGEYGEEWSSMHKRFRKGLHDMVGWYQTADDPGRLLTKTSSNVSQAGASIQESPEDDDTDLVIILVTHGAGCNALIGALTNQPVLMDVGMASLTMAVRKTTPASSRTSSPSHSRTSSRSITLSDQYDVKLIASIDHLRSSSTTPASSRVPSTSALGIFRERISTSPYDKVASPRTYSPNASLGSIRRAASVATSAPRAYIPTKQGSFGLWSPQPVSIEPEEEEQDDMILNFGDDSSSNTKPVPDKFLVREEVKFMDKDTDDDDAIGPLGLWSTPLPPSYAETYRDLTPKRRWTVNERSS